MGGWFNKRIVETKDFKGLKFRMPGLGGEVLKALEPMLFFCPVLTLFQQFRQVLLMELNGLSAVDLGKRHKVCKYYYYLVGTNQERVRGIYKFKILEFLR